MSSSKLLPTLEALNQALVNARKQTAVNGSLWVKLLEILQLKETVLQSLLLEAHGVACLVDEDLTQIKVLQGRQKINSQSEAEFVTLSRQGQVLLLTEDPWQSDAAMLLSRSSVAGAVLAVARPHQMAHFAINSSADKLHNPEKLGVTNNNQSSSPVVDFVDQAIAKAYEDGASDIHFETGRHRIVVKYRLDGVMAAGAIMETPVVAEEVVSRIKVLAQLDITERRKPQDGRFRWQHRSGDNIDLRVSIMPSIFGEDAVLRLLDKAQLRHSEESMSLDVLGFDDKVAKIIRALAERPHGMLLITGPTGSGKTTTVYAALTEVNNGLEKIITIEDPVEYELPGVLQIPVNEQKGLTFATGLRSILRHDPDKILVGEIRDPETAEIAVQSSLTGHLVFTTVHANSLLDVLGRFQHFGIEPFALASALNGVVVQRLLRKVCKHCVQSRLPTDEEIEKLKALDLFVPARLPVAVGCQLCRETGYKGRFVVAEVHQLSDKLRDLLVHKSSISELKKEAYIDNSSRLLVQAINNVQNGITTLEEVSRAIGLV
jgi:general secretion pathway protein E